MQESIIVVGAGHSGTKAAAALRKEGWTGTVTLIGDELHAPYDRPPLSKAVLLGKKTSDQCAFFPAAWYIDNDIELLLGEPAASIDRPQQHVVLRDGRALRYHRLLLATGSALNPLRFAGVDLQNVWPLRTPNHADAIARLLQPGQRLVVIGAGVIGQEVAAAAIERGCTVLVLEVAAHAMARSLPLSVSSALIDVHRNRGVDVRLGLEISALEGDEAVSAVRLTTGEALACDLVVYGVGVRPRTELADAAGLSWDDGVRTNSFLQTDDEKIFACGDVCRYESRIFGRPLRLENWRNAEDQADTAARNMLGQNKVFDAVPWFWSNQFDMTLQVAGLPILGETTVARSLGSSRLYLSIDREGVLRGASGLGFIRDVATPIRKLRAALASGCSLAPDRIDDRLQEILAGS